MDDDNSSIDLAALLQTLRRGRTTILTITAVAVILAIVIAFLIPPRYTSVTTFIPPNGGSGSSLASALGGQLAALGAGDLMGGMKTPGDLYVGILKSRSIAQALVKEFNLKDVYKAEKQTQAEQQLTGSTLITADAKSSIITISVSDRDPALAQKLADGYVNALRETNGRLALTQSAQRAKFFSQQLAQEKDNLENAEVDLKKTEEQSGLIAPLPQTDAQIRIMAQTQAEIAGRQVQLAALRQSATDQNPDVIRLQSEIGDLQRQLANLQHGSSGAATATIPTSKVPEAQLAYLRKEREVKYHEALFEILSKQYEAARLDESREAPLIQVLDPASYPDGKSSPKRTLITLGGLLIGLIGSCSWVLLRARARNSGVAA
jgi:uncharacterized protein involved in exopolysaccharide biosynthesis